MVISPYFFRSPTVSSLGVPRPYVLKRWRCGQHVMARRDSFSASVNWRATDACADSESDSRVPAAATPRPALSRNSRRSAVHV